MSDDTARIRPPYQRVGGSGHETGAPAGTPAGSSRTLRPMRHPGSGDGFVLCSDGQMRWGLFGAAGVVFVTAARRRCPS